MVLVGMWLEDRRRKRRAKSYQKAYELAVSVNAADGFATIWTDVYEKGHRIAYAMGYDHECSEAYAVSYAEIYAFRHACWAAYRRRQKAAAPNDDIGEPPPPIE